MISFSDTMAEFGFLVRPTPTPTYPTLPCRVPSRARHACLTLFERRRRRSSLPAQAPESSCSRRRRGAAGAGGRAHHPVCAVRAPALHHPPGVGVQVGACQLPALARGLRVPSLVGARPQGSRARGE